MAVDPVAVSIALSAGAATFFSPCAVSLVPAYVGYFVGTETDREEDRDPLEAALSGARFSGAAAAGILALFALGGLALFWLRRSIDLRSTIVGDAVVYLGIAVGGLLVVLGLFMLADRSFEVTLPLRAPSERTLASMAGFGVVFAAGSVGCSLPVFFSVVVQAFAQGALGAFVTFLAYGIGLAGLMVVVGVAISVAEEQARRRIRQIVPYFRPVAGAILIAGGLYTAWYYAVVLTV